MIVRIQAFDKQPPNLGLWEYTFITDLLFSEFILRGCLLDVKQPLRDNENYYGSYDIDVENWNLKVDIINPDYIKENGNKYDLEIRFLPNDVHRVQTLGFQKMNRHFE